MWVQNIFQFISVFFSFFSQCVVFTVLIFHLLVNAFLLFFYAVENGIIFSVSLFDSSLLVYKMLILYPAASLNWLINSNSFDGVPHPVNIELSKNSWLPNICLILMPAALFGRNPWGVSDNLGSIRGEEASYFFHLPWSLMIHLRAIVLLVSEDGRSEREHSISKILILMDLEFVKNVRRCSGSGFCAWFAFFSIPLAL